MSDIDEATGVPEPACRKPRLYADDPRATLFARLTAGRGSIVGNRFDERNM